MDHDLSFKFYLMRLVSCILSKLQHTFRSSFPHNCASSFLRFCTPLLLALLFIFILWPVSTAKLQGPPIGVLYDQSDYQGLYNVPSQEFESVFAAFDGQAADDFIVPTGGWTITRVEVLGAYSSQGGSTPWVNVYIYADAGGLPGVTVYSATQIIPVFNLISGGALAIDLPSPIQLPEGVYWLSVQADMDFDPNGQWFWRTSTTSISAPYFWQNPGNGFGRNCTTWALGTAICGMGVEGASDLAFRLMGPLPINGIPLTGFQTTPAWLSGDRDITFSLAWGDMDGDGDLDLATGGAPTCLVGETNCTGERIQVYLNINGTFQSLPVWQSANLEFTHSVAWGDVDNDGDLDLAAGNENRPSQIYLNENGTLQTTAAWQSAASDTTWSVAWGDVDNDGDLDLATGNFGQPSKLYLNENGMLQTTAIWQSVFSDSTTSIAWGDVDNDGDLDLAAGNADSQPSKLYLNVNGTLQGNPTWVSADNPDTSSIAWGDIDGDGDLDLAAVNFFARTRVYLNQGNLLQPMPDWLSADTGTNFSVAWGDADTDGDLDLAVADTNGGNKIYLNENGRLSALPAWRAANADLTWSVAWGDVNGDGDLDLATGNNQQPNKLYENQTVGLRSEITWPVAPQESTYSIAWGDVDNDGDLDLATSVFISSELSSSRLYLNTGGTVQTTPIWQVDGSDTVRSIAWGDIDGDGDLDLATGNVPLCNSEGQACVGGENKVYLNIGGMLQQTPAWQSNEADITDSIAWGDIDGDGDLDLATGNVPLCNSEGQACVGGENKVYLNIGGMLQQTPAWQSNDTDRTYSIALGDMDGDGDLDLAVGNVDAPNKVYLNKNGNLEPSAIWQSVQSQDTSSIAWGDVDGDGDLDLAAGKLLAPIHIYMNHDGILESNPSWASLDADLVNSVAWGDADGDGDLDLAVGNINYLGTATPNKIYINEGGNLQRRASLQLAGLASTRSLAWGDMDNDGLLDLAVGNTCFGVPFSCAPNRIYLNRRPGTPQQLGQSPALALNLGRTPANFYATANVKADSLIPFTYTLYHPANEPVRFIRAYYSPDGGGQWLTATATSDSQLTNLTTSPFPTPTLTNTHVFTWDVEASGFLGQSDNVLFRLEAYPSLTTPPNGSPGPFQSPYVSGQTFPFRIRGTQVQVISDTVGIARALVYRLPAGQPAGGMPLADGSGVPFRTNNQGYLQGRGQIAPGDRLLALAPVDWTETLTWAVALTDTLHLYYTNGTPTELGVDTPISNTKSLTVTQAGVQTLAVSPAHPLLLFDLEVSLEWDASNDPSYLNQLQFDLQRASEYLYDFSNGQVALGRVTVYQNKEHWDTSHVLVLATNRLRPFAVQGGIVLTDTTESINNETITYSFGQVVMGATWNRYGNAGENLGQDWPLALAHELSHFFLFLDDTYLGLNDENLLIAVDTQQPGIGCTGSAMGDVYLPNNTEFIFDENFWQQRCGQTLQAQTLHRNEWATIKRWYPWLISPTNILTGPSLMPFDLTDVVIAPFTPTNTLADPTFNLDYEGGVGVVSSSRGQGFLLREETIIDLGSPAGGQNRLLARGAHSGDRLCAFDFERRQYGCETIEIGDERLSLERDDTWTPLIYLTPVNTRTFDLTVTNPITGLPLRARLYPELDAPSPIIELTDAGNKGVYQGQFPSYTYTILAGHIQLWVEETAIEDDPRRESIVAFSIGGNPPKSRGSGPKSRGSGPKSRGSGAPLVSPDGQFIFFIPNPAVFKKEEFYTIQEMAGLPVLPSGKKAIGPGYRLVAFPSDLSIPGSVSFQYLGLDALVEQVDEEDLTIHFWDGTTWQALATNLDAYYNLASAPSQGQGIYALLAGVTPPVVTTFTPTVATNDVTTTLIMTGQNFLPPVRLNLLGETGTYTYPAQVVYSTTITAMIPAGLPAQEYQPVAINGDQGAALTPGTLSMFEPKNDACFYDFFESGANKWQRGGEWAIVTLKDGQTRAMTDSPTHPYLSAPNPPLSHTLAITSSVFSLQACSNPQLTFHHAYDILNFSEDWGTSQDVGRVEISTSADWGVTWSDWIELHRYHNGGDPVDLETQTGESVEWSSTDLQPETIDLSGYSGLARLRFSLEADIDISGKGWVVDDVMVGSGGGPEPSLLYKTFLPLIVKDE